MYIDVIEIEKLLPKWIGVSMENMSSFFRFCVSTKCRELSDKEFSEWAGKIGYITSERDKTYRLKTVFPVCKSIYEDGFDYYYVPNVVEGDRVTHGRHRICITVALGATHVPVLHVGDLEEHRPSQAQIDSFFFSSEGKKYLDSLNCKLLSGKNNVVYEV